MVGIRNPRIPRIVTSSDPLERNRVFHIYGKWRMASANDDSRDLCALYVSMNSRKARIHSFFCSVFENIPRNNTRE